MFRFNVKTNRKILYKLYGIKIYSMRYDMVCLQIVYNELSVDDICFKA